MKRLLLIGLMLAQCCYAQVTTAPSVSGVAAPQSSVAITGGTVDGTPVGATTPSSGAFTTLSSTQGLLLPTVENAVAAFAGGGQTSATALSSTATFHRITTVTTSGDSVKLPTAVAGAMHCIRNDSTSGNSLQVFGTSPDTINGVATATGVGVSNASGACFMSTVSGAWTTLTGSTAYSGGGNGVRMSSPTLTTPTIGVATGTSLTNTGTLTAGGTTLNASPAAEFQVNGSGGAFYVRTNGTEAYFTAATDNYFGCDIASCKLNLLSGAGSTAITISGTGDVALPGVTTGTNADFVCMASGNKLTLQTSACTISSKRFKNQLDASGINALAMIDKLKLAHFTMKPMDKPNVDINFDKPQLGLYAEDVATVDKRLAIYEQDGVTPKSYRQEAIIALLVKGMQEQQRQIHILWGALAALALGVCFTASRLPRPLHSSQ